MKFEFESQLHNAGMPGHHYPAMLGGTKFVDEGIPGCSSSSLDSTIEIAVAGAVAHVRLAEANLRAAAFRLDDADYFCKVLNDLACDVSALLTFWAGRAVPCVDNEVPHIAAAAREWRQRNGRSY